MSISPKLSNSVPSRATDPDWYDRHEMRREAAGVLRRLVQEYRYQIKFVIGTPEDVLEMEQFLVRYPSMDRNCVYLMPEGTAQMQLREIGEWLEPLCAANGFHFCPRKHIEWFGHVRGT